ncbi:urea transporter 2-like isoform X1 [Leucoraja erinacea]|nr:urea transporter 2-like isoform X1 [Leucoraja erinacea]XP_055489324.1 urea transporter 2-like isoform X1 [Leucoraja erinacea]XP_055489330.1 urea transporter 2-like isoform X1 [Leucoraja erinacea]
MMQYDIQDNCEQVWESMESNNEFEKQKSLMESKKTIEELSFVQQNNMKNILSKGVHYLSGDMREFGYWIKEQNITFQFIDWVLRGSAQVMFVNNPLSGLVILIGLVVQNPWWALNGFLGTVFATLAALLLNHDRSMIAAGLSGYNGILVGLLLAVFCDKGDWYWWLLLAVILMSMFCPIISSALAAVLGKWDLPVFTLPFNLSVGLFMAATGHYNHHFPQIRIEPVTTSYNITWPDLSIPMLLRSIPVGVGQVYGCDNPWTGGIFFAALFISSPIICLHAVIGSCVGTLAGLSLASPFQKIYNGLWSYNSVLACIAVGGMFYALTWQTHILAIICSIFCAYLGEALMNIMSVFGLPACTWPFCLSTIMFLLMTSNHKAIYKLALHEVTYPEKNRKIYLEMKKIEQIFPIELCSGSPLYPTPQSRSNYQVAEEEQFAGSYHKRVPHVTNVDFKIHEVEEILKEAKN